MSFDIGELQAEKSATMMVYANGRPTNWVWVLAGPGHAKTEAESQRLSRELLHRSAQKEQALANGKKWKANEQSPNEVLEDRVTIMVARVLEWYMVDDNNSRSDEKVLAGGKVFEFSAENVRTLLMDANNQNLFAQVNEFLSDTDAFMQRSATNSKSTPSENLNSVK